jgi:hypothetical protein
VIAFPCFESRPAAARMIFPERGTPDAVATLTRAQGGASRAEFARPMSRRQITERRTVSLLPPPRPDAHSDLHQKRDICLDFSLPAKFCRLSTPGSCGIAEPPRCWPRKRVHKLTATQTGKTTDAASVELVAANRLFASLVFQQIRPRNGSAANAGERSGSSCEPQPGGVPVSAPDVRSPFPRQSRRTVTFAQAASPEPPTASIEALLTELARRRLRSLAAKERP